MDWGTCNRSCGHRRVNHGAVAVQRDSDGDTEDMMLRRGSMSVMIESGIRDVMGNNVIGPQAAQKGKGSVVVESWKLDQ